MNSKFDWIGQVFSMMTLVVLLGCIVTFPWWSKYLGKVICPPCPPPPKCHNVFFQALGDLPGDCYSSQPHDITSDGSRIAGESSADLDDSIEPTDGHRCTEPNIPGSPHTAMAMEWNRTCEPTALTGLGYLPGHGAQHAESFSFGISPDGKVAVGYNTVHADDPSSDFSRATVNIAGTFLKLPLYKPMVDSSTVALDISQDGAPPLQFTGTFKNAMSKRIIIGYSTSNNNEPSKMFGATAIYWDAWDHVMPLLIPDSIETQGVVSSEATGITDDGRFIIGNLYFDVSISPNIYKSIPCVWKRNASTSGNFYDFMTQLDDLPGGMDCARAIGIAPNGSIIVGWGHETTGVPVNVWDFRYAACFWDLNTGSWSSAKPLTPLSGYPASSAYDVSNEGTIIGASLIITGTDTEPVFTNEATMWKQAAPTIALEISSLLPGIIPSEWRLGVATEISDDGKIIAGYHIRLDFYTEGWVIGLP